MSASVCISPVQFEQLKRFLPAITREHIMNVYGVSETTWAKLRDGLPIKLSTYDRIISRHQRHAEIAQKSRNAA